MTIGQHIDLVPKDLRENLRFRKNVAKMCRGNKGVQRQMKAMCAEDILFYVNTFVWTYDSRLEVTTIPFITYDYQDLAFGEIDAAIGHHDLLFEKSRDMGASWMLVTTFQWRWHFRHGQSFLLVSRNEEYVDTSDNPKALFWKIDFILKHLPRWMVPLYTRTSMRLTNNDNGSSINGESTTGEVARGDRRTAIALDEFSAFELNDGFSALSSTRDATNCRIFNFTPIGIGNAAYEVARNAEIRKLRLHWTQHPVKSVGLYVDSGGKPRSPWYDLQCKRAIHPWEIAQELDINYLGADFQYFDTAKLERYIRDHARDPFVTGDIDHLQGSLEPTQFVESENGSMFLWFFPNAIGKVDSGQTFAIGADVSQGTGATPSVASVGCRQTGEKVAVLRSAHLRPEQFARIVAVIARWFNGAFVVAEANGGPGQNFINVLMEECNYRNVFYREDESAIDHRKTLIPGWWSSKDTKLKLIHEYRMALESGEFINRDRNGLEECRKYVFGASGLVANVEETTTRDLSASRHNHADTVIADALVWKGMKHVVRQAVSVSDEPQARPGSLMWRRKTHERAGELSETW